MSATWADANHTWDDTELLWSGLVVSPPPDQDDIGGGGGSDPPADPTPAPTTTPGGGFYVQMGKFHYPYRFHVRRR